VRGLVARRSFELVERSKQLQPPSLTWWYDRATAKSDSGIFRLRACSRLVIVMHAASEALSNSGPPPRWPPCCRSRDWEHRCAGRPL